MQHQRTRCSGLKQRFIMHPCLQVCMGKSRTHLHLQQSIRRLSGERISLSMFEFNSTASVSPQSAGAFNTFNSPAYSLITFTFL